MRKDIFYGMKWQRLTYLHVSEHGDFENATDILHILTKSSKRFSKNI